MNNLELTTYASKQSLRILSYSWDKLIFDKRLKDIVDIKCSNLTIDKNQILNKQTSIF